MSDQDYNPYRYTETPFERNNPTKKDRSTTGLVLGLVSIIAWFIPLFGFPVTICGIIFSAKSLDTPGRGKAIAGLVLSIIFLCLTIINSIVGAVIGITSATQGM
jgi:hypothetical protein